MSGLRLVHVREVVCWPWHLRDLTVCPFIPAACRHCGRDVACPTDRARETPVCLYCGIDRGLIDPTDRPLPDGSALS